MVSDPELYVLTLVTRPLLSIARCSLPCGVSLTSQPRLKVIDQMADRRH